MTTDEGALAGFQLDPPVLTLQFQVPGRDYSVVRLVLTDDRAENDNLIVLAVEAAKTLDAALGAFDTQEPQREPVDAPQTRPVARSAPQQARPQSGAARPQGAAQGQSRASQYPVLEGWACDVCGGPVGRYPKKGAMRSDKAVCLGKCKDGQFVHSVAWLDDYVEATPF